MSVKRPSTPSALFAGLPAHTLTESARARRVRLVVTPAAGLRVVVPRGFDHGLIPAILRERLDWIEHHLERAQAIQAGRLALQTPPEYVEFRAVGRVVRVRYLMTQAKSVSARRAAGAGWADGPAGAAPADGSEGAGGAWAMGADGDCAVVTVRGAIGKREDVYRAMRAWLVREAKAVLPGLLAAESARLNLPFTGVGVRLQRSRWGSYSARGTVSLNAKLLFLPPEITRYVLAHELAHSRHLDHSARFWAFLERICPGAASLDKALRHARDYVPAWAAPM